ncbi:hypothetical protein PENANT_c008G08667 [Penicillium antarcticum]|uniref:Uncharacterized protein n=1 Tax=Penicillium antarcticum TaxID=416450 RepID=A0A1V6QAF0_9EURO|nr:hypothetical protein PENANT_c008G08667 [Penicillium antarcticum]
MSIAAKRLGQAENEPGLRDASILCKSITGILPNLLSH